jgi:uncharacterized protein YbaA (DUF1428 family)
VQPGKPTSFPQSVKLKPDETVVFAWIVYKSRAHHDRVNAKAMSDPRLAGAGIETMPFDAKRMFRGASRRWSSCWRLGIAGRSGPASRLPH